MAGNFYSFSDPLNNGIDFYNADDGILLSLSGNASIVVNATKVIPIAASLSASADVSIIARKIIFAEVSVTDILAADVIVATTIREGSATTLSGSVSVSTSIQKVAYAASSIACTSSLTSSTSKIAFCSAQLSGSVNTSVVASGIVLASSVVTPTSSVTTNTIRIKMIGSLISVLGNVRTIPNASTVNVDIFLATIRININNFNSSTTAEMIRFSPNITADSSLIRALLLLDGSPLTNQSRTFDISAAPVFIENINWAGDSSRYYKNSAQFGGSKRTFNAKWSFIPNKSEETVDRKESRNYLKDKAMDSDIHTLTIVRQDENGLTPYTEETINVFITNFNENLIRRDLVSGVYYFGCAMTLEEV
jgi:hypothetical protein